AGRHPGARDGARRARRRPPRSPATALRAAGQCGPTGPALGPGGARSGGRGVEDPGVEVRPVLALRDVRYRYADAEREAIASVSLTVSAGEWVGVIGPTNAGKSTLCYLAMGLAPHFFGGRLRGELTVFGVDTRRQKVAERSTRVGLLFQNPFTQLSGARERVSEEVAFGSEWYGMPADEVGVWVREMLMLVYLEAAEDEAAGLPSYARLAKAAGLPPPWPVTVEAAEKAFQRG